MSKNPERPPQPALTVLAAAAHVQEARVTGGWRERRITTMMCGYKNPLPRSTHPPEHCPLSVRGAGRQTDMALSVPRSLWNTMNVKVKVLHKGPSNSTSH